MSCLFDTIKPLGGEGRKKLSLHTVNAKAKCARDTTDGCGREFWFRIMDKPEEGQSPEVQISISGSINHDPDDLKSRKCSNVERERVADHE